MSKFYIHKIEGRSTETQFRVCKNKVDTMTIRVRAD